MLLLGWLLPAAAPARDVCVMLSGGADPFSNNYSQYLQARAMAEYFRSTRPAGSVWTFFGAGNVAGRPPLFGDVLRQVRDADGVLVDSWLPGALPDNRPARREAFLRALRDEILPAVQDGGTLFLFVGDHGSETGGDEPESAIDLWGLKPDAGAEYGWADDRTQKLTVSDLRRVLREGLGRGRVVFCMTQCHSGGFHDLGAPGGMPPEARWFTSPPDGPAAEETGLPVAGFTATDAVSLAAGCDPAPDPDTWAGYERFLPESLLGLDLLTPAGSGRRLPSFFAAHVEATLADDTIDLPRSTSEHYLERWATLIETKLEAAKLATPALRRQLAAYRRAVDTGNGPGRDPALAERRALFARFEAKLLESLGGDARWLRRASRQQLEDLIEGDEGDDEPTAQVTPAPARPRRSRGERHRLWNETLRPAWKNAVLAGRIEELKGAAREFELRLLAAEEDGRRFTVGRGAADNLVAEVFWRSGYHDPATLDAEKAGAIARWGAVRAWRIGEWARALPGGRLRRAAAQVFPRLDEAVDSGSAAESEDNGPERISLATAASRVLFYRRVLAAWEFLLAMDHQPALAKIAELTALERTPLPVPSAQY